MKTRVIIIFAILMVSAAHWLTPLNTELFRAIHIILRLLFIAPLLLAAIWVNLRGAVLAALAVTVFYLPHVLFQWTPYTTETINQLAELGIYWILALLCGTLTGRERAAIIRRREAEEALLRTETSVRLAREIQFKLFPPSPLRRLV